MKIAIIGSGISGLTCGYHLHRNHNITVFEANDYIGGHTETIDVEVNGEDMPLIPALSYTMIEPIRILFR